MKDGHRLLYRDYIMVPIEFFIRMFIYVYICVYIYIAIGYMSLRLTRNNDRSSYKWKGP